MLNVAPSKFTCWKGDAEHSIIGIDDSASGDIDGDLDRSVGEEGAAPVDGEGLGAGGEREGCPLVSPSMGADPDVKSSSAEPVVEEEEGNILALGRRLFSSSKKRSSSDFIAPPGIGL